MFLSPRSSQSRGKKIVASIHGNNLGNLEKGEKALTLPFRVSEILENASPGEKYKGHSRL